MFGREVDGAAGQGHDVVGGDVAERDRVEDGGHKNNGGRSRLDGAIEAKRKRKYPVDPRLSCF